MKIKLCFLFVVLAVFMACGGGDSSTDDDPSGNGGTGSGVVDDAAEALAVAARETSTQIVTSESSAAGFVSMSSTRTSFPEVGVTKDPLSVLNGRLQPYGTEIETDSETGECGGTLDRTTETTTDDETVYPVEIDSDWEYDNYCLEDDDGDYWIRLNGSMTYYLLYTSQNNGTRHLYYDLSYTSNFPFIPSGTLSYAKYCTIVDGYENCNVGVYESETTTYYTENVTVSGNASSGYDISYIITDNEGHSFSVEFTDLTSCESGGIEAGSGSIGYNGDEIGIEFIECGEYEVTYQGNTETYFY